MTKRITLTRKGFREWLEGKPGRAVIGTSNDAGRCPFARYLRSQGAKHPLVFHDEYAINGWKGSAHRQMPLWAGDVVIETDAIHMERPITARQALAVLDGKGAGA